MLKTAAAKKAEQIALPNGGGLVTKTEADANTRLR